MRLVNSPPAATDGLYYLHTDHLGSVTLMTLPSGALHSEGTAKYQPFGDFQHPPAANPGLTRQGYTGHQHHNTGDSDIGLIYMNARYYLPNLARFASPDPLIPDPANPQALNRYTYVLNNPLKFTDPTGHCAGEYNTDTGIATGDQECWDFLFNQGTDGFCAISGSDVCNGGGWRERLGHGGAYDEVLNTVIYYFASPWAIHELITLANAIHSVQRVLDDHGYNGVHLMAGIRYQKWRRFDSMTFPKRTISLGDVSEQTIWHETGHAISFINGHIPQREYLKFAQGFASAGWLAQSAFCYRAYCYRQYSPLLQAYTGKSPELFADAFAAWVYMETTGSYPTHWITDEYEPNWHAILRGIEWSLIITFNQ